MSGSEAREVYLVMSGDTVEGVYTDKNRAKDRCAAIIRAQVDKGLSHAYHWQFNPFYLHGVSPIVWPRIVTTEGALDEALAIR